MTAKLYAIPSPSVDDVPRMLRAIADEIESGVYGSGVDCCVVALPNMDGEIEVFGLGAADGSLAHLILARAQRKLEGY